MKEYNDYGSDAHSHDTESSNDSDAASDNDVSSDSDSSLELIDMTTYNRDTTDLILSDKDMYDIVNGKSKCTLQQKYLSDAFRFIRSNKLLDFRKVISGHIFIINSKYNKTFLIHEACRLGNPEFVSLLLFLGARCNMLDDNGLMAQHYAVKSKQTVIVDIISLFGNSMNVKDIKGNTPLHYATKIRDEYMVRTLMVYKADPNVENGAKVTPKDNCSSGGDLEDLINGYIEEF